MKWKLRALERYLEAEITLFKSNEKSRPARLKDYLETLLHELIHAFFNVWGCRADGCSNEWEVLGVRGHGYALQDTALALETAMVDKDLMALEFDLGRLHSLAVDIASDEKPILAQEQLQRWEMKQGDVNRICKLLKEQHIATQLMARR